MIVFQIVIETYIIIKLSLSHYLDDTTLFIQNKIYDFGFKARDI